MRGKIAICVCAGAVAGTFLDAWVSKQEWNKPYITGIQTQDLISLILGLILTFFGSKIHPMLRWFGIGILAREVSVIVSEVVPT